MFFSEKGLYTKALIRQIIMNDQNLTYYPRDKVYVQHYWKALQNLVFRIKLNFLAYTFKLTFAWITFTSFTKSKVLKSGCLIHIILSLK